MAPCVSCIQIRSALACAILISNSRSAVLLWMSATFDEVTLSWSSPYLMPSVASWADF